MINKKIIQNLISAIISISMIVLFIILLPSILILLGALILFFIIVAIIFKFTIAKKSKINFVYVKQGNNDEEESREEIHEMKDVTNSSKSNNI
jgi:ABC-type bacteriocin/lantibiotic exporter with double-glycine peptidase domain